MTATLGFVKNAAKKIVQLPRHAKDAGNIDNKKTYTRFNESILQLHGVKTFLY